MASTRRSSRSRFILALLVLTAGTVVTLTYRGHGVSVVAKLKSGASEVFAPVQRSFTSAFRPVSDFFTGAFEYGSLKRQNQALRAQLGRLQRQRLTAADAERRAAELSALTHLPFAPTLPRVTAMVISTSASNFQQTIEIDRGTASGVTVGDTAVAGAGLVGRVTATSAHTATVLLVDDPSSTVGVRVDPPGLVAVADGQGDGKPLTVNFLQPDTKLSKGQVFVTSGLQGSIFPPGIPVGVVASVGQKVNALQEDVTLTPVVNLRTLDYVDVLVWPPPAPATTATTLPASPTTTIPPGGA